MNVTFTAVDTPELNAKYRRWVQLTCVAMSGSGDALDDCVRDVLRHGEITLAELLEFVLQYAVFAGWPKGSDVELAIRRQWERGRSGRGNDVTPWPALDPATPGPESWEIRLARGEGTYRAVLGKEPPRTDSPFAQTGTIGFVFGQVWRRPRLVVRERRVIAISSCALLGAVQPLKIHIGAALGTADLSVSNLRGLLDEFSRHASPDAAATLRSAAFDVSTTTPPAASAAS
jgi:4-carboxymuconolactone decarboxylase